jgi:homoserine kinase type II
MDPVQAAVYEEISEVLAHYDLGELVKFEQNLLGYNNTNFRIRTDKLGVIKDYFFRRYKAEIHTGEIIFEHAVINHLLEQDFDLVAGVHPTKKGETYIARQAGDGSIVAIYYAVFDFLEGEDRYTWIDPQLSSAEVQSTASVLAQFHHAVASFNPPGQRVEPKILDLLPSISENIKSGLVKPKGTVFDDALAKHSRFMLDHCSEMQAYCASVDWSTAPQMVIHCDFHPGNLKFRAQEVVGFFDFDWSKIDLRCFDVGLAIWYLSHWKGDLDGTLRLNESLQFLKTYQETLAGLPNLEPLTEFELQQLPVMINLGNLYILNWTVVDYYSKPVDADEYLVYLQHSIRFSSWFSKRGWKFIRDFLLSS